MTRPKMAREIIDAGNAVPVRLALAVAEPIAEFAKKELQGK